jgi:hypothetical protein
MCRWAQGGDGRLTAAIREAPLSYIWPPCNSTDRRIECGAGKNAFGHSHKLHPRSMEYNPSLLFGIEGRRLGFVVVVPDNEWWGCVETRGDPDIERPLAAVRNTGSLRRGAEDRRDLDMDATIHVSRPEVG